MNTLQFNLILFFWITFILGGSFLITIFLMQHCYRATEDNFKILATLINSNVKKISISNLIVHLYIEGKYKGRQIECWYGIIDVTLQGQYIPLRLLKSSPQPGYLRLKPKNLPQSKWPRFRLHVTPYTILHVDRIFYEYLHAIFGKLNTRNSTALFLLKLTK